MSGRYESNYDRRRHTKRKGQITTVIAAAVILIALVAILLVVLSLIKKNNDSTPQAQPTAAVTEQPTLYIPAESSDPAAVETTVQPSSAPQPTAAAPSETPAQPTEPSGTEPTEKPEPSEVPYEPMGDESYTDDEGVLHVYTPAGYNWTYYYDGESVKITCKPHFDINRYEFLITGLKAGTTEFNLYYYTDPDQTLFVKIPVTAVIDDNLRITRIE